MLTLPTVSVPEPATAALVATGIAGVVVEARRRRKNRDDQGTSPLAGVDRGVDVLAGNGLTALT